MQEFINWGGETPEQLAERRRFEEEMREFMINKMLMEAARNQGKSSSAAAAIGGGGGDTAFEITDSSAILVYYNQETNTYDYFTMNPASQTFTEAVSTGVAGDSGNISNVYPINQKGYVIVFNKFDNSYEAVFISAQGELIDSIQSVPTSDLSFDVRDGKFFYFIDLDANQLVIFDGTSVRVDTTILTDASSYSIGTNNYPTTASSLIINLGKTDQERGNYKEWWSLNADSSTLLFQDYSDERQRFSEVNASFQSNYLLVVDRDYYGDVYAAEVKIINLEGEVVWSQAGAYDQVSYWFYGLGDSLLIILRSGSDYLIKSFDPTVSLDAQEIVYTSDSQYSVKADTYGPWSVNDNPPSEAFAILFYDMVGDSIPGNMANVNNSVMITKFKGQEAVVTELTDSYINIWDFNVTDDVVLLPVAVEGETVPLYKIRKATRDQVFESFVNGIEFAYDGDGAIYASAFNRVAHGFLFEIAYSPAMTSFIHFIGNDGVLSTDGVLPLVGIPYNDAEINWNNESGPLLYDTPIGYYVWLPDTKKWELIDEATGSSRYSTRNYSNPTLTDGVNYFLAKPQARLYWFSDEGMNEINDGGNDMYDGGNRLYASSQEIQISYTHTQFENGGDGEITDQTLFTHDGQVQSGAEYGLGQASTYFTNLYPGLFVLSALNVETDRFKVDGGLGADGSGRTSTDIIDLAEAGYKLYLRRVWGAGDPSINQLMIIKATDHNDIAQDFSWNTDDDFHLLYNLDTAGVTEIHYLLFALANGVQGSLSDITNFANDYVALVKDKTDSEEILTTLSLNHSTLLLRLPSHNPTSSAEGWIVKSNGITPFELSPTDLDSVRLGSNGLLILTRDSERLDNYTIDHYDLSGRLVSHIETDYPDLENVDSLTEREIFIFNEAGHQHKRFIATEGYTFVLNDFVWWD